MAKEYEENRERVDKMTLFLLLSFIIILLLIVIFFQVKEIEMLTVITKEQNKIIKDWFY